MERVTGSLRLDGQDVMQILRFTLNCVDECLDKDPARQDSCTHKCLRLLNNTVNYVGSNFECSTELVVAAPPTFAICMKIISSGYYMLFTWAIGKFRPSKWVPNSVKQLIYNMIPNVGHSILGFCQRYGSIFGIISAIIVVIKLFL